MKKDFKVLVVCKHSSRDKRSNTCRIIKKPGFQVLYSWTRALKSSDLSGIDFVISIGGDGTALSASHYLKGNPLLAVNSSPKTSEGALTTININQLDKKLSEIKKKGFHIEKLERITAFINGKKITPRALNELSISNSKPYLMSKYIISLKSQGRKIREKQNSSGIIFSTGTGSTAWFKSAGGEPFSPQAKYIRLLIREPYIRNLNKFSILEHKIPEKENIIVKVLNPSTLSVDSIREFKLNKNDQIRIHVSKEPLLRII